MRQLKSGTMKTWWGSGKTHEAKTAFKRKKQTLKGSHSLSLLFLQGQHQNGEMDDD